MPRYPSRFDASQLPPHHPHRPRIHPSHRPTSCAPPTPDAPEPLNQETTAAPEQLRELVNDIRAGVDAVIHEQEDRLERWQQEQEQRLEQILQRQRAWLDERLAELSAAIKGAGGAAQNAAERIVQAGRSAHTAAAQTIDQLNTSIATNAEALAQRSAAVEARIHDTLTRARDAVNALTAELDPRLAAAQSLTNLCERAEHLAGTPAPDAQFPVHEAPAAWPPAPAPGSLADLLSRAQATLDRARPLINDLARQAKAAEAARTDLGGTLQDSMTAVRAQREQLEQVRRLVQQGFEAGFSLERVLGDVVQEAQSAEHRIADARETTTALRAALAEARQVGAKLESHLSAAAATSRRPIELRTTRPESKAA